MTNKIILHPYQKEAINIVIKNFNSGKTDFLVTLPTGSGKTEIFLEVIGKFLESKTNGHAMILVHRDELIKQAYNRARNKLDCSIGIVKAKQNEINNDLIVASVQTLSREKRLNQIPVQGLLIIDEAHHAVANSYQKIIRHLKEQNPNLSHFGVTATPYRGDKLTLRTVYNNIVYSKSPIYMIKNGYSAPIKAIEIKTNVNMDSVHLQMGDFKTNELTQVVNVENRNQLIVDAFKEKCKDRKALAYCVDVAHTKALSKKFRDAGFSSDIIVGETPIEERTKIYENFRDDDIDVLCNCQVLTEGYDERSVNAILVCRPTQSKPLYIQMIGRGTRLSPETGKKDCLIVDFTDNSYKYDIMTFPNLIGKEYTETNKKEVHLGSGDQKDELVLNKGSGLSINNLALFDESPLDWHRHKTYRGEAWSTPVSFSKSIILRRQHEHWDVWEYENNEISKISESPEPLEFAAEIEKMLIFNKERDSLIKNVWWHEEKITEKQAATLSQKKFADIWKDKYENIDEISRGEASAMITYLFAMGAIYYMEKKI